MAKWPQTTPNPTLTTDSTHSAPNEENGSKLLCDQRNHWLIRAEIQQSTSGRKDLWSHVRAIEPVYKRKGISKALTVHGKQNNT